MNDFLEAFDGYIPYVALVVLAILFRSQAADLLSALRDRVRAGASVKVGALELGELVESTPDAKRIAEATGDAVQVFGDPDQLKLLFKAQGGRWKKSTKAMEVPGGCLVQVTTERLSSDGDWTTAEALALVPGAVLRPAPTGEGYVLGSPQ